MTNDCEGPHPIPDIGLDLQLGEEVNSILKFIYTFVPGRELWETDGIQWPKDSNFKFPVLINGIPYSLHPYAKTGWALDPQPPGIPSWKVQRVVNVLTDMIRHRIYHRSVDLSDHYYDRRNSWLLEQEVHKARASGVRDDHLIEYLKACRFIP